MDDGFIRLPNNYCIIKVSEVNRNLALMLTDAKTEQSYYRSVVDFDIIPYIYLKLTAVAN